MTDLSGPTVVPSGENAGDTEAGALRDTAPAEIDALIGQSVGNYRVVGLLGEGGMGRVYRAEHPEIGRQVAIKVVHALHSVHPSLVSRFRSEAMAVNRIGHPNIIDISDFGALVDGRPYFVMEFLEGEDLGKRLARVGRMSEEAAAPILLQTLDALGAAHAEGIIHRDLKPDNVYLARRRSGPETVKLLDFGVAKLRAAAGGAPGATIDGTLLGTPMYMSPEQALGHTADISPASDVYSMGIILYQMFTGEVPFDGQSVAALLIAHAHEVPAPPSARVPGFDPGLERVILRCLEKSPGARFPSARALCDALSLVMPGLAEARSHRGEDLRGTTPAIPSAMAAGVTLPRRAVTAATQARAATPSPSPRASRKPLAVVIASGAVLALLGGALYYARRGPEPRAPTEISAPPLPGPMLEGREG